jgi:polar amino acid transport system substrate-binding protein
MKKFLIAMLSLTMALSLAACGGEQAAPPAEEPAQSETAEAETPAETETPAEAEAPADAPAETEAAPEAVSTSGITGVADLEGKRIGVQQGTTGDIYSEDIADAEISRFNKGSEAVLALVQGKVDAVVIDDLPAKEYVKQNPETMILDEYFTQEEYAICFSKDNAALTAEFNTAIEELKADGTLQQIIDYYINNEDGTLPRYQSPEGVDRSKGTLTMATNATFPPYEFYQENEIVGIDADISRAICDKLGYELVIEDMEFDSIITAIQTGKASFGAAAMTITEDRLKTVDFTTPYAEASQVIIVLK